MPYFVHPADLDDTHSPVRPVERLFVETWMNSLQSRTPAVLSPPPFSILGLLENIRQFVHAGTLKAPTAAQIIATVLNAATNLLWLPRSYAKWDDLLNSLRLVQRDWSAICRQHLVSEIEQLQTTLGTSRVEAHASFIYALQHDDLDLVYNETLDLLSDLIGLGHSESFLYGWGRAVLLGGDPAAAVMSLTERLQQVFILGQRQTFVVLMKISPNVRVIPSDRIRSGRNLAKKFKTSPLTFSTGENGLTVTVTAADPKAAVSDAVLTAERYLQALRLIRGVSTVTINAAACSVLCSNTGEESLVDGDTVRPYEAPRLTMTNAITRLATQPTRASLERALYWFAESQRLSGDSEFLSLWLALCALFDSDRVTAMVRPMARYAAAWQTEAVANWIQDFLRLATSVQNEDRRLSRSSSQRHITAPSTTREAVRRAITEPRKMADLALHSPLLLLRIEKVRAMASHTTRDILIVTMTNDLQVLLPWFQSIRHAVAHLGSAALPAVELANRRLAEFVATTLDEMTAAAFAEGCRTVSEIHSNTHRDFAANTDALFSESCFCRTHVRLGKCIVAPSKILSI